MSVPITCPHCGRRAKLKSAAALGKKKPCPGCGETFTLRADAPEEEFADEFADPGYAPAPPPRRSSTRSSGRSAKTPAGKRRKKKSAGGSNTMWWVGGGLAVGVLMCGGCFLALLLPAIQQARQAAERNVAQQEANRAVAQTPVAPLAETTADQAEALGEAFVAAAESGNEAAIKNLFDVDAFVDGITSGMTLQPAERAAIAREIETLRGGLATQYAAVGRAGGFRLLSVREVPGVEGPPGAVVRMLPPEGGMNYLVLYPTGTGKIGDLFVFLSGERITATMRRFLGSSLGGPEERAAMAQIAPFSAAARGGDADGALRIYEGLPEELKANRGVQALRATAAQSADPAVYEGVLNDIDRRFPGDPSIDLLRIDAYAQQPEKLIEVLGRLNDAVGGDAHLMGMRAQYLPDVGRAGEAVALARAALDKEPDSENAVYGLLAGQIGTGDHAAAVATLERLRDDFGLEFESQAISQFYTGGDAFLQSPEYRAFAGD